MNKDIDYYMSLKYPIVETHIIDSEQILSRVYLKDIPAIEAIDVSRELALHNLEDIKREWFAFAIDEKMNIPEPPTRAVF